MRRINGITIAFLVVLAVVLVAGCAPAATDVPTQVPTFTPVVQEGTPAATSTAPTLVVPSATPVEATPTSHTAPTSETTPTSVAVVTDTPFPTAEPYTMTPTAIPPTPLSPTPTPTATAAPMLPTNTAVPPTATATRVPATATATRVPTTATAVPITDWRGEYFDNPSLQGSPDVVRNDRVVDFDLDAGEAPAQGIPAENWSARWSRQWTFDQGNYRFQLVVDDGARVWINDRLLIDAWQDGSARELDANLYLSGQASIRVEYYNHLGQGRVRFNWERVTDYPDWQGSYYPVRDLSGAPRFERNDATIDFNWGAGSPRGDIPADDFSVRWTRRLQLAQSGTYRFLTVSDDGVRLWVDGRLLIDAWRDGYNTNEATIDLAAGGHDVRLEYYEHLGGATVRLTWSLIPATATSTATGAPATATSTATAAPATATPTRPVVSNSPTPTTTSAPPTATATSAPPTATRTPAPPTPTVPPVVPPGRPEISLRPAAGPVGQPIAVVGTGWPANVPIELYVTQVGSGLRDLTPVGQTSTGPNGSFQAQVAVPLNAGWESRQFVAIVARVAGQPDFAQARYEIQGARGGRQVPFSRVPSAADRYALGQPTFLALNSAEAWAAHFGQEPPRADPPVNWSQEYVLGAFLGAQPSGLEARVQSVTVEDGTVVVHLGGFANRRPAQGSEANTFQRVLIRVSRAALGIPGEPTFRFVDAAGQVLASGVAGAAPLGPSAKREAPGVAGTPSAELGAQAVPGATEEAAAELQAPFAGQAPEAGAAPAEEGVPELGAAPAEEGMPQAAPGEIAGTRAEVRNVPWQQSAFAWIALLAWGALIVFVIGGVFLLLRRATRRQ